MGQGRFSRYLPLGIWLGFIFLASTEHFSTGNTIWIARRIAGWLWHPATPHQVHIVNLVLRKAAHFSEYAVLSSLAARAFYGSSHRWLREQWLPAVVVLVVAYALLDEYHQSFVPSRSASIYDSLIDTCGGLAAAVVFAWLKRRSRPKRPGALVRG